MGGAGSLKAGVPVKVVQERVGHANPSIAVDIYVHALPRGRRPRPLGKGAAFFGWYGPVAPSVAARA